MLNSLQKSPAQLEALARVREWTRVRFDLPEEAAILVSEVACGLPGCPPLETVVAFWSADATRHQFKMFKPVQGVVADDLPYAWLKDALVVPEGFEYDCC
jgi:nitrate reductase delta subunit